MWIIQLLRMPLIGYFYSAVSWNSSLPISIPIGQSITIHFCSIPSFLVPSRFYFLLMLSLRNFHIITSLLILAGIITDKSKLAPEWFTFMALLSSDPELLKQPLSFCFWESHVRTWVMYTSLMKMKCRVWVRVSLKALSKIQHPFNT